MRRVGDYLSARSSPLVWEGSVPLRESDLFQISSYVLEERAVLCQLLL